MPAWLSACLRINIVKIIICLLWNIQCTVHTRAHVDSFQFSFNLLVSGAQKAKCQTNELANGSIFSEKQSKKSRVRHFGQPCPQAHRCQMYYTFVYVWRPMITFHCRPNFSISKQSHIGVQCTKQKKKTKSNRLGANESKWERENREIVLSIASKGNRAMRRLQFTQYNKSHRYRNNVYV